MSLIYNIVNSYDDFISNEKDLSCKYNILYGINPQKFSNDDYIIIEKIFKNDAFINIIYEIIDDLIVSYKIKTIYRHVVLGDLFFAFTFLEFKNVNDIFYTISRNEYIIKISERADIYYYIDNIDKKKYIKIHQKLLIGLCSEGIITKKIIKTYESEWNTNVFLKLNLNHLDDTYSFIRPFYSEEPFHYIKNDEGDEFLYGSFRNIWKFRRKKREMDIKANLPINGALSANKIGFIIKTSDYKLVYEEINKEKERILSLHECKNINEFFNKIKEISKNITIYKKKYVIYQSYIDKETKKDSEDMILNKMEKRLEKMWEIYKIVNVDYQKIISFYILEQGNIFDKNIYLPCFIDNRSRQYYGTLISPTFYKLFRFLYSFNREINEFRNLEKSKFYKIMIKYKNYVIKYELCDKKSYILIILFIEIGKFFIKKEEMIKTENFLTEGIKNYEDKNYKLKDFSERIYIKKIYEEINKIITTGNINNNLIIFKDATASGLQNYGILWGYREDKLKYLNLNGNEWCDTYSYLINKFLKTEKENLKKRRYWKKTIMTIPYNASWYRCFIELLKELREDGIDYYKMNDNDKKELLETHKNFYNSLKNELKNEFYTNVSKDLMEHWDYLDWTVLTRKDVKITYKRKRDKYQEITYEKKKNEKASERAMEANNAHYLDAKVVRYQIKEHDLLTVHDCYGVRLCEMHLLIDNINKYFSSVIKLEYETYSPFIII